MSSQTKITAKYLWTYVVTFGGTIHTSLPIITSRYILSVQNLSNHGYRTCRKPQLYIMDLSCQHVMKASPNITVRYRNSICTITAVQTMLTYVIETTYSRGYRKMRGYE
jgi:hypothetical protein